MSQAHRFNSRSLPGTARFLSLWKYLDACPHRFLSTDAYTIYLNSLQRLYASRNVELSRLLHSQRAHLDDAYRHADEICSQDWHDAEVRSQDDYGWLIFIDRDLYPAYLRLTEAVFRPLLHIPAYFSRLDRGKGTEGLDLHQIVQELTAGDLDRALDPYDHLMRNGSAHGGITYSSDIVQYVDKRGNQKQVDPCRIIRRFDDLLDVCNGLLLAFSIFMLTRDEGGFELLANLLVDELRAATTQVSAADEFPEFGESCIPGACAFTATRGFGSRSLSGCLRSQNGSIGKLEKNYHITVTYGVAERFLRPAWRTRSFFEVDRPGRGPPDPPHGGWPSGRRHRRP